MLRIIILILAAYVLGGPAFDGWRPEPVDQALSGVHHGVNRDLDGGIVAIAVPATTRGALSGKVRLRTVEGLVADR
jgi:hypothetical protein